jgi:nucleoside-diphosphate-sugar epimerase
LNTLIIGGTRNLGHLLALELLRAGHRVTVLNRGQTPDELPADVERLRGDRGDRGQVERALGRRSFDVVVDTTLYNGVDAQAITGVLGGRVGHYVFLSTGQVYLVREDVRRPFNEDDYAGAVTHAPPAGSRDHAEWAYGIEKRHAEDVLARAWESRAFPATSLRLPMVNGERDHHHRIHGYFLRLRDGGPILLPRRAHLVLRHVYAADVVKAIITLIRTGAGKGRAYNLSQDETLSIEAFLAMLAREAGSEVRLTRVEARVLEDHELFPDCSPFSDLWMSELDNQRSKVELGIRYTPVPVYLRKLVDHYERDRPPAPPGYARRRDEIELAAASLDSG